MKREKKVSLQLRAVSFLRVMKSAMTYDELSEVTDLTVNDLNRYVNGHVLPGLDRSQDLLGTISQSELSDMLEDRIDQKGGYIDNTGVVFDQPFLNLVPPVVSESFEFGTPDVVLTAATDGISIATAIASYYDVRSVYAKKQKEIAVEEFVEVTDHLESGIGLTYYLPESSLRTGQRVLVVDDLIRSGETQELLLDITEKVGSEVVGVFTLIAVGSTGINRVRNRVDSPVEALTIID